MTEKLETNLDRQKYYR